MTIVQHKVEIEVTCDSDNTFTAIFKGTELLSASGESENQAIGNLLIRLGVQFIAVEEAKKLKQQDDNSLSQQKKAHSSYAGGGGGGGGGSRLENIRYSPSKL